MAQRRMFSLKVVDTDLFLDMPASTQNLYFHLGMRGDDDGFVSSPKKIMKIVGSSEDDMKLLIHKNFVIPCESGICVIKHWRVHNYIQKDRYTETIYKEERAGLQIIDNQYVEGMDTKCIQNVSTGKVRLELEKELEREEKEVPLSPIENPLPADTRAEIVKVWNELFEVETLVDDALLRYMSKSLRVPGGLRKVIETIKWFHYVQSSNETFVGFKKHHSLFSFLQGQDFEKYLHSIGNFDKYKDYKKSEKKEPENITGFLVAGKWIAKATAEKMYTEEQLNTFERNF